MKFKKKNGGVGWGGGRGGQGRCELRCEVSVKIKRKNILGGGGVRSGGFKWGVFGFGGGVRVDVNEELCEN